MSIVKMKFEEVESNAKIYGQAEEQINTLLAKLTQVQTNLNESWEGKAMQAFDQQFEELAPKVKDFAELMKNIEMQLMKVKNKMQEMDEALHAAIMNV